MDYISKAAYQRSMAGPSRNTETLGLPCALSPRVDWPVGTVMTQKAQQQAHALRRSSEYAAPEALIGLYTRRLARDPAAVDGRRELMAEQRCG